jgi:hypothetical protein
MNQVNVMFTFQYYSVITTVDVENIDDAVEAARELLHLEGVSTDAQDITVEVSA